MFNFGNFLSGLEQVGLSVLAGAATSNQSIHEIDASHPAVSAAVDVGQIGASLAQVYGIPVAQIAELGLGLAKAFASMSTPKPAPAVVGEQQAPSGNV